MANNQYEPYGEEWSKEMHRLPKLVLIEQFKQLAEEKNKIYKATELFNEITTWQEQNFNKSTALSCAKHLRKEIGELIECLEQYNYPFDELADNLLLLMHIAKKLGLDFESLMELAKKKYLVNRDERKWGEPNAEGFTEHLKH